MRHRKHAALQRRSLVEPSTEPAPASALHDVVLSEEKQILRQGRDDFETTGSHLVALALGGLVMVIYLKTLYPSVAGGDSGELVAESCHLGVSHPPGYPLFNMLVYLVTTYLPGDSSTKAWKANAFSAACDTAAAVFIYRTLLLWTSSTPRSHRKTAAFTASALFAFSPLIWTYAVGAEVFALNNLFASALIYVLVLYSVDRRLGTAITGAFMCGLAMCNQHTIILFEIPIVIWVLWTRRATLLWREFMFFTLAFVGGLLPYAYMPITAIWNPQPGSWGDLSSVWGFVHHLRRADYGTFRLFSTNQATEDLWTRLKLYGHDLSARELPLHLACPLAVVGLFSTLSAKYLLAAPNATAEGRPNGVGRLVALMYAFYMVIFHALANLPLSEGLTYGVHMRFWQQPNVVIFLWVGIGVKKLLDFLARRVGRGVSLPFQLLSLALVVAQIGKWYAFCDQSDAYYIRNYASALVDPLPQDAVLFVNFDLQWTSLRYLQRCENRRPDVTIINFSMMTYEWFGTKHELYPNLRFPGSRLLPFGSPKEGFTFAQFLDANYVTMKRTRRSGIFFGGKLNYNDQDFNTKYQFVPFGLLDEIQAESAPAPTLKVWYASQQKVQRLVQQRLPVLPPADKYDDETWEWTIARDHAMKRLSWSTFLLEKTIAEDPHNLKLLSDATHAMEWSYQFEPLQFWTPVANLKNLGLAYAQIVKSKQEFVGGADPFLNEAVGHNAHDRTKFKDRASARMLEVWNEWLSVPEARQDPAFSAIEGIVRQFVPNAKIHQTRSDRAQAHRTGKRKLQAEEEVETAQAKESRSGAETIASRRTFCL